MHHQNFMYITNKFTYVINKFFIHEQAFIHAQHNRFLNFSNRMLIFRGRCWWKPTEGNECIYEGTHHIT